MPLSVSASMTCGQCEISPRQWVTGTPSCDHIVKMCYVVKCSNKII